MLSSDSSWCYPVSSDRQQDAFHVVHPAHYQQPQHSNQPQASHIDQSEWDSFLFKNPATFEESFNIFPSIQSAGPTRPPTAGFNNHTHFATVSPHVTGLSSLPQLMNRSGASAARPTSFSYVNPTPRDRPDSELRRNRHITRFDESKIETSWKRVGSGGFFEVCRADHAEHGAVVLRSPKEDTVRGKNPKDIERVGVIRHILAAGF